MRTHIYAYHAKPLHLMDDGGEMRIVEEVDGGYNCWCGHGPLPSKSCQLHVWTQHAKLKKPAVFKKAATTYATSTYHLSPLQTFPHDFSGQISGTHSPPPSKAPEQPPVTSPPPLIMASQSKHPQPRTVTPPPPPPPPIIPSTSKAPDLRPPPRPQPQRILATGAFNGASTSKAPKHASAKPQPARIRLEAGRKYLVSHPQLESVGVMLHSGLHVLKCMFCNTYLGSKIIQGHLESHGFPIVKADVLAAALLLCKELNVPSENSDCAMPHPGGPPVEDIPILIGFACRHATCMHAVTSEKKIKKHQSDNHPGEPENYYPTSIQHLFTVPTRYFAVQPTLSTDPESEADWEMFDRLIYSVIPEATEAPPILIASDDRGRTPIEKHFRWDDLLLPVRRSRKSLMLLADLKKRHVAEEDHGLYIKLHQAMINWHDGVSKDLNGKTNQLDLQQFLLEKDIPQEGRVVLFKATIFRTDLSSESNDGGQSRMIMKPTSYCSRNS